MTTYKEAGVDIDLANKSIDKIKKDVKTTFNKNSLYNVIMRKSLKNKTM